MAERHVDPLFSAAYDAELDPAARRRFDTHLDGCSACAAAWDDYRGAIDAVRTLPAVAMPATVRLPVGPPQVETGRAGLLARWWTVLLHPQPVWAAAGLATVGLAAVVLAAHHGGGAGSSTAFSTLQQPAAGALQQRGADSAPVPPAAPAPFSAEVQPCPVTQVAPAGSGGAAPGFPHATRSSAGSGRELVLATPAGSYAPGASVPIYARLTSTTSGSQGSDVVPCVTLETDDSSAATGDVPAPAPHAQAGTGAAGAPAALSTVPPTPIAVASAQPAPAGAAAGNESFRDQAAPSALLDVVIPANIPRGTRLRLVAFIPAYAAGNPTGMPITAVLYITVG